MVERERKREQITTAKRQARWRKAWKMT